MNQNRNVKPDISSGDSKKVQVTGMFDRIAGVYDFLNHFLSLGTDIIWRRKAIRTLEGHPTGSALDIATGTGDLALEIYKQLKPQNVIGLDISKNMLSLAKKKIIRKGLEERISFVHGDVENLQFEDCSFDLVSSSFGVRNFENLELGLSEMYRILNPGGRIMVLEFSKPKVFPFKQLYLTYFKYILPVIGRLVSKDTKAYSYLYKSSREFPDYDNFTAYLNKVGFKNTKWQSLSLGICTIYSGTK